MHVLQPREKGKIYNHDILPCTPNLTVDVTYSGNRLMAGHFDAILLVVFAVKLILRA